MKKKLLITSPITTFIIVTVVMISILVIGSGAAPFPSEQTRALVTVSFLAAFFGGFLSLISPCSAAMLPVFFAYSFKQKAELLKMTFIFYLGLATMFVPLGFASTLVSALFVKYPGVLFNIAGSIFILLSIMLLFGKSFQLLPKRWRTMPRGNGIATVYIMGILFAFASGTCAAPIIGGIFTIAATSGNALHSIALLLTYALGMVGPMLVIAWFLDRHNFANSKLIQGTMWELKIAGRIFYFHSTNVVTSILFFGVGLLFILSNGTNSFLNFFNQVGVVNLYYALNIELLEATRSFSIWQLLLLASVVGGYIAYKKKLIPVIPPHEHSNKDDDISSKQK